MERAAKFVSVSKLLIKPEWTEDVVLREKERTKTEIARLLMDCLIKEGMVIISSDERKQPDDYKTWSVSMLITVENPNAVATTLKAVGPERETRTANADPNAELRSEIMDAIKTAPGGFLRAVKDMIVTYDPKSKRYI